MSEIDPGLNSFDRCQNRAYRTRTISRSRLIEREEFSDIWVDGDFVEVFCAAYPCGDEASLKVGRSDPLSPTPKQTANAHGLWEKELLDEDSHRKLIARSLGCASCPYPDLNLVKTFIETGEGDKITREIRFEPVE